MKENCGRCAPRLRPCFYVLRVRARPLPFLALHLATQIADPVAHPSSVGLLCTGADPTEAAFCKFYFLILQFQFFAGRVETEIPHDDGFCNLDTSWRQFRLAGFTALRSGLTPVRTLCFLRRKIPLPFATGGRICWSVWLSRVWLSRVWESSVRVGEGSRLPTVNPLNLPALLPTKKAGAINRRGFATACLDGYPDFVCEVSCKPKGT